VQKAVALHRDQALVAALAIHQPNIWIDLSGWSPTYFPPQLVQYANTLLNDRILFRSHYPPIRKLNEPAAG
jgi:uncharacterized protein